MFNRAISFVSLVSLLISSIALAEESRSGLPSSPPRPVELIQNSTESAPLNYPYLKPHKSILLQGTGDRFSGESKVEGAPHKIEDEGDDGYKSKYQIMRPSSNE